MFLTKVNKNITLYRLQCSAGRRTATDDSSSSVEPGAAAAYCCCALQRFAEQASVDCEPAQHQAPRHHTWPGAARCVGKTDPQRPVKCGDSDSRKIHGQTKIPIPELFSKCELMDVIVCAYIHCKIYFVVSTNKIRLKHWTVHFLFVWAMPSQLS